jgi:inosine-uridine nucleoside N-ribohydrolase
LGYPDEVRYWGASIPRRPNPPADALNLLRQSIERGAIIIGIGAYTNLRRLDECHPGILRGAQIVLMGGYIHPPRAGYPQWDYTYDWNVQLDVAAALHVYQHADPLIVPLAMTVETYLRRAYLPALAAADAIGALIARQALEFAIDEHNESTHGATCAGLPVDIINFQHDSLACAIALGWNTGVEIETLPLQHTVIYGWLRQSIHPTGKPTRVVTRVDGDAFSQFWYECMTRRADAGAV